MLKHYKTILKISLVLYLGILLYAVLFKIVSPLELFSNNRYFYRNINLIPFNGLKYGYLNRTDFIANLLLFIPLGVYLKLYWKKTNVLIILLCIVAFSVSLESIQYIFSIGATDISDVILNSIGGLIGILMYQIGKFIIKNENLYHSIIAYLSFFVMLILSSFIVFMHIIHV